MRLIDADGLLKDIEIWGGDVESLHEHIINTPTAYDVYKVIEELKTTRSDYVGDFQDNVAYGLKLAIEIVKEGGKNENIFKS